MSDTTPSTPEELPETPAGPLRHLPSSVAFAQRAAALARVALPVAMLAAGIAAGWAETVAAPDTTCCPEW